MQQASLNPDFCEMMIELLGKDEAQELCLALESNPPSSIRLSRHKADRSKLSLGLDEAVPWCQDGYYLRERPVFTGQAAFHSGLFYVQEASSMLLSQIEGLLGEAPLTALDLCAAPGGKSTLLLDILPKGSVLVANEVVHHRANILAENLHKWGNPRHIVTQAHPSKYSTLRECFDLVLVDAPCSGEGMFRKDHDARKEWHKDSPRLCAERQREILTDVWHSLKAGGLLVYSTCTMNRYENEDIVAYIAEQLGATPIGLDPLHESVWLSPLSDYPCYRMMPHRCRGEGLFMAVFRKVASNEEAVTTMTKAKVQASKSSKKGKSTDPCHRREAIPKEVYDYVSSPQDFAWDLLQDEVKAYPHELLPILTRLQSERLPIVSAGIPVASIKGKSLIPHTALALSTSYNPDAFEAVALRDEELIPYLSREAISLDASYRPGIKLVHWQGIPLGFVKHLGNRSNNLYPQEWRIRHAHKL